MQAQEELRILSGVLKLTCDSDTPLEAGAVYRKNESGGRDIFVHVTETLRVRAEFGEPIVTVTDAEGNVVVRQSRPPRSVAIASIAMRDIAAAKVMRLFSAADADTWVGLYRIYEIVEADAGGESALKALSWCSSSEIRRFKHSANSVAVGGDQSRHGTEPTTPPSNPMSLDEAKGFAAGLVMEWLRSKES